MNIVANGAYTTFSVPLTNWTGDAQTPADVDVALFSRTHNAVVFEETVTPQSGSASFEFHAGRYTGPGDYLINFTYVLDDLGTKKDTVPVKVYVPYLSMDKIEDAEQTSNLDRSQKEALAFSVTQSIDSFCNRSFQHTIGETKNVMGNGTKTLQLPERIWQLDSVTSPYVSPTIIDPWNMSTTAENFRIELGMDYQVFGLRNFKSGSVYGVTGNWGYHYPPEGIQYVASQLFLLNFCADSTYRDRWVSNINTGQWQMEFARTGNQTTGSAELDNILKKYRKIRFIA